MQPTSNKTEIIYDYDGSPTLARFAKSNSRMRAIVGPIGSGKSSACAIEIARRGRGQAPLVDGSRRTRFVVIRNTFRQLEDTTMKTFFDWMPPKNFGEYTSHDYTYKIRRWGSVGIDIEVLFRALDSPESINKLLSLDLTGAWINESREVPWAIVEATQGRLGRYPPQRDGGPSWHGLWMDTNPPDVDSDFYRYFEEGDYPEDSAQIFRQPSGLSPEAENLPNLPGGRKYYQDLVIGKSQNWINVYIHGKYGYVQSGKPVFPEFSDQAHVKEVDPAIGVPIYRSWDFGLTPACAFSQVLPDGRWLVFDEICASDTGIEAFSSSVIRYTASVFQKMPKIIDIGDPAGMQRSQTDERTCFNILHAKGIMIEPGLQTLSLRLESVRKPLTTMVGGMPQFVLHPRCKVMRKAFLGQYRYRRMKVHGTRYTDEPEKNEASHIMDALQYAATRIFSAALLLTPEQLAEQRREMMRSDDDDYSSGRSRITGY